MKKRYIFLFIIILSLPFTVVKLYNLLIFDSWRANRLVVSVDPPLEVNKLKIEMSNGSITINRQNDSELFKNRERYTRVFDDNQQFADVVSDYGENDFFVTYDEQYYYSFRHFKTNRNDQHSYHIGTHKQHDDIILTVNIKGKNQMSFREKMILVTNAENYVANTPIKNAGVIFNMTELQKE